VDTISHALWGSGLFGYRKYRWAAIFFGVMPDLLSFGLLFIIRIFNGNLNYSGLPTLEGLLQLEPFPEWVFAMDNITHSFIIAFLIIGIIYYFKQELAWPMLAWPFHIVLDVPFHTEELFPIQLFWPLTNYYFDGISWSHPAVWFPNVAGIIMLFFYRWKNKQDL